MSGWGFLSKAEGFLDRVLEEQGSKKGGSATGTPRASTPSGRWQERLTKAASQFASTESLVANSTSSTTAGNNEEVQQAVPEDASKDSGGIAAGGIESVIVEDRPASPKTELQLSQIFPPNMPSYIDTDKISDAKIVSIALPEPGATSQSVLPAVETEDLQQSNGHISQKSESVPMTDDAPAVVNHEEESTSIPLSTAPRSISHSGPSEELATIERLKSDLIACESRRIEEAQISAERISALERRLAYFSDESLSKTREISQSSASTSQQKLIAEKDARIALLLEEGDNLSKKELQHLTNAKKLRSRITDLESLIETSLKAIEKADTERLANQKELKEAQDALKRSEAKVKGLSRMEEEVGDLRAESQVKSRIISDLKRQLADADDTIAQNITIFTQLQAEKSKTDALQKRIGTLLTEAKVTAEESAADMADLQGKYDRMLERSKNSELEQAREISRLETEIEGLRANLEESTSNASENSQAKLLRQIESLQTQQSLARQNWARIEESLVMRSTHAEKERDELREQEADLRTRLRQAVLLRKDVEEEKGIAQSRVRILESSAQEFQEQIAKLVAQLETVKKDLAEERQGRAADKEMHVATFESRLQEQLAEERQTFQSSTVRSPYLNDMMNRSGYAFQRHVTESPNLSRTPEIKRPSMSSRAPTQNSRVTSRRKVSPYSFFDDMKSPPLRDDDPFEQDESASQIRPQTEISVSTASAGASVGMMERVSANVRKLELELNIMREDLSRMTRQRDEARSACVEMETIEQERARLQETVAQTIAEKNSIRNKFEATLELLGEQTEQNEQLKEDISDMRNAFKETLSSVGMGA